MLVDWFVVSGYLDSNQGLPAPKAGALTGLRYTPSFFSGAKVVHFPDMTRQKRAIFIFFAANGFNCEENVVTLYV